MSTTRKLPRSSGSGGVTAARSLRALSATIRSMRVGQAVIAVVLVVIGAIRAVTAGAGTVGVLVAGVVFLTWYFGGLLLASRTRADRLGAGWLLGLAAIWAGAVWVSPEFVWLAFSLWLLAGYILRLRWAVVFSVAVFAVVIGAPVLHTGTTTYANIIGPLVGGVFAFGISRGYLELVRDAREQKRLVGSLVQAQSEMADLQDELARTQRESGATAERTRLSRDIHDTIAQGFSSIGLLARAALDRPEGSSPARTLEQIEALAHDNLADVRRIVAALAPAELDEAALAGALERMLDRLAAETGVATELHVDASIPALPTAVEVALLRTAQSAFANVRLHAHAEKVVVNFVDAEDAVRLDVVDDGVGFDVAEWDGSPEQNRSSGYGLHSMRARLRELGGGLDVESAPGDGTALSAHVPLAQPGGVR